jgi:two-component system, NtrC family, sensor kinase
MTSSNRGQTDVPVLHGARSLNRPLKARPRAAKKPTREVLTAALAARERELAEARARHTATAEVLRVISQSPADTQPVFESIVLTAVRLLYCDLAGLFECDEFVYSPVAGANSQGLFTLYGPSKVPIDPSATFPSRAIVAKEILYIPDWSRIELPEIERRVREESGLNSTLYLPLLREGACIALLVFGSNQPDNFGPGEIALAESFRDHALIAIENTRLFNEAKSRTRDLEESLQQQTATADVLKVISRSVFDLQTVLDTLVESACKLCGARTALLYLRGDDAFECKAVAGAGIAEAGQLFKGRPIRAGRGTAAERVILSGEVQSVADFFGDPDFDPRLKGAFRAAKGSGSAIADLRSTLAVPMKRDDAVVGVIVIARSQTGPFPQRQIELLQTFADQAVIAIENARLFDEVEARTGDLSEALQQQTATADVLKAISRSAFDLQTVLDTLVRSAVTLCDAIGGMIYIKSGDAFHGKAFADYNERIVRHLKATPQHPGRGSVGARVLLTGQVQNIADLRADPEYDPLLLATTEHRAVLGVPLLRDKAIVGAIVLGRRRPEAFTQRQIDLVQTFADQAVIAIENVRLFDEVQSRTRDLSEALQQQTATADVLKVISRSAFDLQAVLDTLVESAVSLIDASSGVIWLREGDVFNVKAASSAEDQQEFFAQLRARPQKPGRHSIGARVLLTGEVQIVSDIKADPEYDPVIKAATSARTLLGVPLLRDGVIIGAFVLALHEVGTFTPRQIDLVQTFADQAVIAIENVRLFDEVQARTRDLTEALQQQTATADVLKVISRSVFDLDTVLQTLIDTAVHLAHGSRGTIFIKQDDVLVARAFHRNVPDSLRAYLSTTTWSLDGDSHMARAARDGVVVHIPDLRRSQMDSDEQTRARAAFGAGLWAPLMRDGQAIGVFGVPRDEPVAFTDREIELVQTFSDQAVIAIENVRLFNEVKTKTDDLAEALQQQTATADVLKVISRSAFDLQAVLDTLVQSAQRLCNARGSMIFVRDGEVYRIAAHVGMPEAFVNFRLANPLRADRITAVGRVALTGEMVHLPDALADSDIQKAGPQLGEFRAVLSVPLVREDEVVGIFALNRPEPGLFAPGQVKLVQTFADQAAIAIANVRLFNEVKIKTDDLSEALQLQTATSDVLKVISRSAFDLQAVFDTLITTAVRLNEAFSGAICVREGEGEIFRYCAFAGPGVSPELHLHLEAHPAVPSRRSIAGRAMLSGRIEQIPDVLADPEYSVPLGANGNAARAVLGVPLLGKDRVEGALVLTRREPGEYSSRQIEIVQTFADQAVIAIENVRLFDEVQARTKELAASLDDLRKAQDRLVQSEKLASLGQLTAGIAHEIKNPLNFVNNFSALSRELLDELRELLAKATLAECEREEAEDLIGTVGANLDKVVSHGKRADSIVKNMLLHSREGSGERTSVSVNAMVEEALNLAYHGARAERPGFNVTIVKSLDPEAGAADLYGQEMTRVLLNLISNGFYATTKRSQGEPHGVYQPTITASTKNLGDSVEIAIRDNGTGIPDEVKAKMFNPFFTTKPAGEGTGLGLSLSHDIVIKQHGGALDVSTERGAYTQFTIVLPRAGGAPAKAGAA